MTGPYGYGYPPPPYRGGPGGMYDPPRRGETEVLQLRIAELEKQIREMSAGPRLVGTIVELRGEDKMRVSMGAGGLVEIGRCPGAQVGHEVVVQSISMQPIEAMADPSPTGIVAIAQEVWPDRVEVEINHVRRAVKILPGATYRVGERVLIDPGLSHTIGSLGMPKATHANAPETCVEWGDIGGLEEAKAELQEAIELPFQHPDLFRAYGKRPAKGILLYGPPGTGKTMLAKAAATSIARAHGRDRMSAGGFLYLKGPELLSQWLGESEAQIRAMFAATREFRRAHGYPSVVFLDEADALLGGRDRGPNVSINATTVPQFLAEMDGFDEPSAIFLLATNRPDMLDPAVTREGRVDRKVKIDRPGEDAARQILQIHLRRRPIRIPVSKTKDEADDARARIAARVAADLFSPRQWIVRNLAPLFDGPAAEAPLLELRHLVNGAMLAQIVEQATTLALRRDVEAKRETPKGITFDDLKQAMGRVCAAQRDLDHADAIGPIFAAAAAAKRAVPALASGASGSASGPGRKVEST